MLADGELGRVILRIESEGSFMDLVEESGVPPLPPYISRKDADAEQAEAILAEADTQLSYDPGREIEKVLRGETSEYVAVQHITVQYPQDKEEKCSS